MADALGGRNTPRLPTAGFARRMFCLLYEGLLLIAVGFAATLILVLSAHLAGIQIPRELLQVCLLLVAGCYFVPQWRAGQTLPMKTWRIRLVGLAGEPLTARQSLLRYALAVLSWLLLGGGYLWALADHDAQFLHDRLAHTRLVALPR